MKNHINKIYNTPYQLKLPLEIEKIIEISDPVYTFSTIKWNREYKRARRRGIKGVILEISMISCGFNLHKYHLKQLMQQCAA